jgi:hypothetical protein
VALAGARWFSSPTKASSASYRADKVLYDKAGVMLIPQAMLTPGYDVSHLSILREGRSLTALAVVPGGLLVYAPGYQDAYTDKDALFLRRISGRTSAGSAAAATGLFTSAQPVNVTSPASAIQEYHDVYFDYAYRPYTFEPWFSDKYLTSGTTQSFTINAPAASSGPATLTVNISSLTSSDSVAPDHVLQVLVNGQPVGQVQWDGGGQMLQLTFDVPAGVLNSGNNQVDLATPALDGVDSQIAFVHSIGVAYTRLLDGSKPFELSNRGNGTMLFEVNQVPGPLAWVVDARFSDRASLVPTETQRDADGTYRVRFSAASGGSGRYLFVPAGRENTPLSVSQRQVKAARLTGTYLATGPAQFATGVQPLLMKRSKEGIRGQFIDQEELFDYYNYGRFGPAGIQSAVRATRPQYLLLSGRTTYDYRNYTGQNVDPLCPAFLVSTTFWSQATSDSMFGDLGRGYPEVAVGRLPVNDSSELRVAVSRITGYSGISQSGIRGHLVADETDPAVGNFGAQLQTLAQAHPDIAWQTNTLGVTYATSEEVNAAMTAAANGGADLIVYDGHGNSVRLGKNAPRILDTDLVQAWKGNTVFLQSTCTGNWMAKDETGFKSIAIQALTQPQGGISASIGSSTYMESGAGVEFMDQLISNADSAGMRWGTALLLSQKWALNHSGGFYGDLGRTEQLFGDPAMPVHAAPVRNAGSVQSTPPSGTQGGTPSGTF